MFDRLVDKVENLLKFGRLTRTKGSDAELQGIQISTLRNIQDALKMGNFGINSTPPIGARTVVARIGNENIVIANEHVASIIDVTSGNTVVYNASGHTIKIENDTITTTAPNIITQCETFTINSTNATINATAGLEINAPITTYTGNITADGSVSSNGVELEYHQHSGVSSGISNTGNPV